MKLKLIAPAAVDKKKRGMQGRAFQLPPLSLAALAAVTPDHVDIEIIDVQLNQSTIIVMPIWLASLPSPVLHHVPMKLQIALGRMVLRL